MQTEPTGGTSSIDDGYRDAQVSYRDVHFDYELALRASFARSWRNVERRSVSDQEYGRSLRSGLKRGGLYGKNKDMVLGAEPILCDARR